MKTRKITIEKAIRIPDTDIMLDKGDVVIIHEEAIVKENRMDSPPQAFLESNLKEADKNLLRELGLLAKQYDLKEFFMGLHEMITDIWNSFGPTGKQKYGMALGKVIDSLAKAGSEIWKNDISIQDQSVYESKKGGVGGLKENISRMSLFDNEDQMKEADKVDVKKVIKDLVDTDLSSSNEQQGKFSQLIRGLAFSEDPLSNKFMKGLDKLVTKYGKEFLDSNK